MKSETIAQLFFAASISVFSMSASFAADTGHADAMKAGMNHDKAQVQTQKSDVTPAGKNTHSAAMKAGMTHDAAQKQDTKTASAADAKNAHSEAMKAGMSHDKALHAH